MTKTVFPNRMVAHVWAQQTQPSGKSNNGNFWFEGDTIFSYRTPVARFMEVEGHGKIALVSSCRYSATTSGKHLPAIHRAIEADRIFEVPTLGEGWNGRDKGLDHAVNLAALVKEYEAYAGKMMRQINPRGEWQGEEFSKLYTAPITYARVFDLKLPALKTPKQYLNEIAAAREARNTPEKKAKREKDAAARAVKAEAKAVLQQQELAVRLKAWQEGKLSLNEARLSAQNIWGAHPVYLRIKGETLETSQGASVPLEHAIKAFKFVKGCKEAGRSWKRNGHSFHVGHFTVDSVSAEGTMKAGCHTIAWPQIEEAAKAAGVWDEPASDAALQPSRGAV